MSNLQDLGTEVAQGHIIPQQVIKQAWDEASPDERADFIWGHQLREFLSFVVLGNPADYYIVLWEDLDEANRHILANNYDRHRQEHHKRMVELHKRAAQEARF